MAKRELLSRIDTLPSVTAAGAGFVLAGGSGGSLGPHLLTDTSVHIGPLARAQVPQVAEDIDANIAAHTAIANAHHDPVTAVAGIAVCGQRVLLAINSGLNTTGGNELVMGQPQSLSATTTNLVSGNTHAHQVVAFSDGLTHGNNLVKFDVDGAVIKNLPEQAKPGGSLDPSCLA